MRSSLLVDPSREEALGLVDLACPCRSVIPVHADLDVLGIFLHGRKILDFLQTSLICLSCSHSAVDGNGAAVGNGASGWRCVENLAYGAGSAAEESGILEVFGVVLGIQHLDKTLDLDTFIRRILIQCSDILKDIRHLEDCIVSSLRG